MNKDEIFETTDYYLSISIIASDYPLAGISSDNNRSKATFVFLKSNKLEEITDQYWNETLLLQPQKIFFAQKQLRSRLYQSY